MKKTLYNISIATLSFALCACNVGPDYVAPDSPQVKNYTGEGERQFTRELPTQWWKNFKSPALNQLVNLSIKNNYSLQAMRETLKQAQENVKAAQGQSLPQINATPSVGYQKYGVVATGNTDTIPAFDYYSFGPNLTWTLDIFGKNKRTIEQQQALVQYQQEELRSTQLTLTGNIVTTTFTLAMLNAQIVIVKNILRIDQEYLHSINESIHVGSGTQEEFLQAEKQLHDDEMLLPPLLQQVTLAQGELNILVGKFPTDWQAPALRPDDFTLPQTLPLSLPSQLVHQRPDILAAEALLHAASANVGVATANLYPQITLSANIAQEALSPGQLFDRSSTAGGLVAGLTTPLFSAGILEAQKHAAEHAYKASYANYQDVVVRAFVQISNVLHALNHDDENILASEKSLHDAEQTLQLIEKSTQLGNSDQVAFLKAERAYQLTKITYIQAITQRFQDTAQLYLAMGSSSI